MRGKAGLSKPKILKASVTALAMAASASALFLFEAAAAARAATSGPGSTCWHTAGHQGTISET